MIHYAFLLSYVKSPRVTAEGPEHVQFPLRLGSEPGKVRIPARPRDLPAVTRKRLRRIDIASAKPKHHAATFRFHNRPVPNENSLIVADVHPVGKRVASPVAPHPQNHRHHKQRQRQKSCKREQAAAHNRSLPDRPHEFLTRAIADVTRQGNRMFLGPRLILGVRGSRRANMT